MDKDRVYTYNQSWSSKFHKIATDAKTSPVNKKLIKGFQQYLFSQNAGKARVTKLTQQLVKIVTFTEGKEKVLKNSLNKVTRQHIMRLVSFINQYDKFADATKSDYRRVIKQFYKWYKEEDARVHSDKKEERIAAHKLYHYIENEVKRMYKEKEINPADVLSDEDIEQVVSKGCRTVKEKALLKFLHETGVRAGELLNMRVKDIVIKTNFCVAQANGKTGRRPVQITRCMSYISQWLTMHPTPNNPEAFLWLGESPNNMHSRLQYRGLTKLIRRCFERAKVSKRCNPHWFRHSRATLNAPFWTEQIMCKYFGWAPGSRQVRTYVHLCSKQVEDAFLKMNGLHDQKEEDKNKPQVCGCGAINDSFARYCYKCGNPLSVATALQDQEVMSSETSKAMREMMEMFQKPEIVKAFMEFKERMS